MCPWGGAPCMCRRRPWRGRGCRAYAHVSAFLPTAVALLARRPFRPQMPGAEPCTYHGLHKRNHLQMPGCTDELVAPAPGNRPGEAALAASTPDALAGVGWCDEPGLATARAVGHRRAGRVRPVQAHARCATSGSGAWVIGQLGQSLDGCVATRSGDSCFINGPEILTHLHRLRALSDAVIVGAGTVACDNPRLTTRHVSGPHPTRVLLDPTLRLAPLAGQRPCVQRWAGADAVAVRCNPA